MHHRFGGFRLHLTDVQIWFGEATLVDHLVSGQLTLRRRSRLRRRCFSRLDTCSLEIRWQLLSGRFVRGVGLCYPTVLVPLVCL